MEKILPPNDCSPEEHDKFSETFIELFKAEIKGENKNWEVGALLFKLLRTLVIENFPNQKEAFRHLRTILYFVFFHEIKVF